MLATNLKNNTMVLRGNNMISNNVTWGRILANNS